jgi:hypothetical protein
MTLTGKEQRMVTAGERLRSGDPQDLVMQQALREAVDGIFEAAAAEAERALTHSGATTGERERREVKVSMMRVLRRRYAIGAGAS